MFRLLIAAIIAALFLLVVHSVNAQQPRSNVATFLLSTPEEISTAMFQSFVYVPDIIQFNVWDDQRSYANEVRRGKKFKDDCDGFAITARDLLRSAGIEAWLVVVESRFIGGWHMFAAFRDPKDGVVKTLDNRYPGIRTYEKTISGSMYRNPIEIEKASK